MTNGKPRVALLIDADNSPASKIGLILNELSTFGETNVRRAYGNWKKTELKGWEDQLHEHAIRPIQQFDYSKGKNASDMAMVIDALDLLYTDRPDAFGIVSSDADFTPLVMHLRSKGAAVFGFGAAQTPKPFVNACSRFLYLESLGAETDPPSLIETDSDGIAPQPLSTAEPAVRLNEPAAPGVPARPTALRVPSAELRNDQRLLALLRNAVKAVQDEAGWANVGALGSQIANKTSFDPRNYGYASLSKLLAATEAFDLREEGTSRVAVRARSGAAS